LVINSLWAWAGGLGVSKYHGIVSSAYGVYRIRSGAPMIPAFVHEVVRSSSFSWELRVRSKGVWISRLQLTDISFLDAPMHIPPPAEQAAIVRFLDWANGRLDRAIRAKRNVIALLNEQKQAIIHRTVTRGLDPSVPLKPSGIPWLGDVPQHWELQRLKWVLRLQRGFDLPSDRRKIGSVPVYSSGGHIDNHNVALASPPGIVIGRYGSTDAVFFVTEPYWPHNTALFTTTMYDNHARWCFYLLRSFSKAAHAGKSAVPGVDRKDLFDIVVPRPPIAEQSALAAAIDMQLAEFDRSIVSITKEIELLREYRTRLVADVVTGKLDVREAAARLPDEAAPDSAEEDTDLSVDPEAADEKAVA
jgi:type I restriction enzyme S subunit